MPDESDLEAVAPHVMGHRVRLKGGAATKHDTQETVIKQLMEHVLG
ncbi:MAG: hypothetical protein LRY76_08970 [Alphaproteobacteria bacterium]|nr:hypothetical protein [Alphaproteobacteria bacterium]